MTHAFILSITSRARAWYLPLCRGAFAILLGALSGCGPDYKDVGPHEWIGMPSSQMQRIVPFEHCSEGPTTAAASDNDVTYSCVAENTERFSESWRLLGDHVSNYTMKYMSNSLDDPDFSAVLDSLRSAGYTSANPTLFVDGADGCLAKGDTIAVYLNPTFFSENYGNTMYTSSITYAIGSALCV